MIDFLFALVEIFCYLLRFWSYDAKCIQLSCFYRGSTSLHLNFTWTGVVPINHSWRQKTRHTGLPDGEDRILLHSLVLTQYWSVIDRWMDRYAVALYTVLAKLALRCAVKTFCIMR